MDWQLLTGISAAVIALCALGVSIWQVRQGIKYNRLAVKPNITAWTEIDADAGYYCIWLTNNGLGPAIIETFIVNLDGHEMPGIADEPMQKAIAALFPGYGYKLHSSSFSKGYAMSPKERCKLCEVRFIGEVLPSHEDVMARFSRGEIVIDYTSIYEDETFHFSLRQRQF